MISERSVRGYLAHALAWNIVAVRAYQEGGCSLHDSQELGSKEGIGDWIQACTAYHQRPASSKYVLLPTVSRNFQKKKEKQNKQNKTCNNWVQACSPGSCGRHFPLKWEPVFFLAAIFNSQFYSSLMSFCPRSGLRMEPMALCVQASILSTTELPSQPIHLYVKCRQKWGITRAVICWQKSPANVTVWLWLVRSVPLSQVDRPLSCGCLCQMEDPPCPSGHSFAGGRYLSDLLAEVWETASIWDLGHVHCQNLRERHLFLLQRSNYVKEKKK